MLAFLHDYPLVPAPEDPEGDWDLFREYAYLVTHAAYVLTNYNQLLLRETDAPWIQRYLRENFDAVLASGDVELVAEFVDVFRSMGRSEADDPDVRAGTDFLLATQNPDGSWGRWRTEADAYFAMHYTWCAVCGLRDREPREGTVFDRYVRRALREARASRGSRKKER